MKKLATLLTAILTLSLSAPVMADVKKIPLGTYGVSDKPLKQASKPASQTNETEKWKFKNGITSTKAGTLYYAKWDHDYGVYFTTTPLMECRRINRSTVIAKINGQPVKFKYGCMGFGVYYPESRKGREFVKNAFKKSSMVRVQDLFLFADDLTFSAMGFTKAINDASEAHRKAKAYEKTAL